MAASLLWNALCLIPIAIDMAKKILLDRKYDKPLIFYSRSVGMAINELFSSDVSLWNQYKYVAFKIYWCRILMISYKMLMISGISNETRNELIIFAILCRNATIF